MHEFALPERPRMSSDEKQLDAVEKVGSMARTTIFDPLFRTAAGKRTFIYWQTVPLRRLTFLLLALFCLFGMIGFVVDLFALGQKPVSTVIIWTIFTGAMAVTYLVTAIRSPQSLLLAAVVHLLGSRLIAYGIHQLPGALENPPVDSGVKTAAFAVLALSMAACLFFLLFIQREGRHSVGVETELSLAHSIQQTLVPKITMQNPRYEIYGVSVPSDNVGGDVVDAVVLPDGGLFAYVADIAGHGLSAGILMGMLKTSIRTQLLDGFSPTAIFERLNRVLPAVKEDHMYATCTALRLPPMDSTNPLVVEYAIAAQPPILHFRADAGWVSRLGDQQLPIGLLPEPSYRSHTVQVRPRDLLLIATDGILDAENRNAEAFGLTRLEALLLKYQDAPLADIADQIHKSIRDSYQQLDDQSLLVIKFR
jgi:serine phosphatase RsbU (regulator of sigma subunit)